MNEFLGPVWVYLQWAVALGALTFDVGLGFQWWAADQPTWMTINTIVGMLGLGSVRSGLNSAFANLDLTPVKTFLAGYKTYIIVGVSVVFNGLVLFGVLTMDAPLIATVDVILAALGFGTLQLAKLDKKAAVIITSVSPMMGPVGTVPVLATKEEKKDAVEKAVPSAVIAKVVAP